MAIFFPLLKYRWLLDARQDKIGGDTNFNTLAFWLLNSVKIKCENKENVVTNKCCNFNKTKRLHLSNVD